MCSSFPLTVMPEFLIYYFLTYFFKNIENNKKIYFPWITAQSSCPADWLDWSQ